MSSCFSSDNGFPELTALSVAPATVDVRRRDAWLTVTARPVDDGGPGPATGITELGIGFTGELGSPMMRPQPDGTWVGRLRVPRGVKPGEYTIDSVRLRDGSGSSFGNVRDYYRNQLEGTELAPRVTVVSDVDRRAPRLRSLHLSATRADVTSAPARIRVRARVVDVGAGTAGVSILSDVGAHGQLRLRSGTARDGIWAGTLTAPKWMTSRSATYLIVVGMTDRPGNERLVYSDELAKRRMPSSLTVTTRRPDRTAPRLETVTLSPSVVDLTGGDQTVTVTVHAVDRPAGVGNTYVITHPLHLVAGTRRDGRWRRAVTLDRCAWRTNDARLEVIFFDRANNRVAVRQPLSVVNRTDIRAPYPSVVGPENRGPTDPVTYRFSEDVVGISATSAPVRPTYSGAGFGTGDPPAAVAGNWACASSAGAPVDCAAGPVRAATWAPTEPLKPGQAYGVDFNPEHVLDVLDLSGNPISPTLRYEDEYFPTWSVTG